MGKVSTKLTIEVKFNMFITLKILLINKNLSRLLLTPFAKSTLPKGESKKMLDCFAYGDRLAHFIVLQYYNIFYVISEHQIVPLGESTPKGKQEKLEI